MFDDFVDQICERDSLFNRLAIVGPLYGRIGGEGLALDMGGMEDAESALLEGSLESGVDDIIRREHSHEAGKEVEGEWEEHFGGGEGGREILQVQNDHREETRVVQGGEGEGEEEGEEGGSGSVASSSPKVRRREEGGDGHFENVEGKSKGAQQEVEEEGPPVDVRHSHVFPVKLCFASNVFSHQQRSVPSPPLFLLVIILSLFLLLPSLFSLFFIMLFLFGF